MTNTPTINDAIAALEAAFPTAQQDSWDNSGLIIGNAADTLRGVLISVDITEDVVDEAIERGCNLIVAHHPILFRGCRRINGKTDEQRTITKAIKNDISLYASHTCADKSPHGTSARLGEMIGLKNCSTLIPEQNNLLKITTFVPEKQAEAVRLAMFAADAGHIGNYSHCSYNVVGEGTFMPHDGTNPFVGTVGKVHAEKEVKIETITPRRSVAAVIKALVEAHPYEEPAYDIYPLENQWQTCGYGVVGTMEKAMSATEFLDMLATTFGCKAIRHNHFDQQIKKVAVCTGSGSEFIRNAINSGAQAYITADIKYHQFAEAENKMMIADIGHYESEHLTKQLFLEALTEKLHNFAPCLLAEKCNNPVEYHIHK